MNIAKVIFCCLAFLFFSLFITDVCKAQENKITVEQEQWISKNTFTLLVSAEDNKNSFIRTKANQYHSWSKKLYVNSSVLFNVFWQILDFFIGGFIWFIVFIADVFSGRFAGAIGGFIDIICYRIISVFAIFHIYL